ncbi:unnamed protein product [Rhizophagus irregularis]|nr:unnamed protein product [Rhizophagus irregularis]
MTASSRPDANQNNSPRGKSLENDLKQLLYDKRFFDIKLRCSDEVVINACKAILSNRCNVFNNLIFDECGKINNDIKFYEINSTAMKILLEFLYTSKVEKERLTVENVVEVYYAAIYFELDVLQECIIEFIKQSLEERDEDLGKKLLSQFVEKFSTDADNEMAQVLVDLVAKIKLVPIDDSLSLFGLKYLLCKTFRVRKPFATTEFSIWEYAMNKVKRIVINTNSTMQNYPFNMDYEPNVIQEIKDHLKPLLPYLDLCRMESNEITDYVEPLDIFPTQKLLDTYRRLSQQSQSQSQGSRNLETNELACIRGIPIFRWMLQSDDTSINISKDGFKLEVNQLQNSVKFRTGDIIFKGSGLYEWDIVIKKLSKIIYIGICSIDEDVNKNEIDYHGYCGWVLGSDGYVYHKKDWKWYDARFKESDIVTVHLDMTKKSCSFSVNGIRRPNVSEWTNISSEVRPVVSIRQSGKLRVQPHI